MRKLIIAVVIITAAGIALGFTDPGHRVLAILGLATASCSTCN